MIVIPGLSSGLSRSSSSLSSFKALPCHLAMQPLSLQKPRQVPNGMDEEEELLKGFQVQNFRWFSLCSTVSGRLGRMAVLLPVFLFLIFSVETKMSHALKRFSILNIVRHRLGLFALMFSFRCARTSVHWRASRNPGHHATPTEINALTLSIASECEE